MVLRVKNLTSPGKFSDVSFDIKAGEIVGFAGLVGAGRSEIAEAVFGLDKRATGSVHMDGTPLPLGSIKKAMRRGIGFGAGGSQAAGSGAEDERAGEFFAADAGSAQPAGIARSLHRSAAGAANISRKLRVKTPSLAAPVAGLSGGNQQKIVLAKWLAAAAGC